MDYVLLKNGKLIQGQQIVKKDLLIGNNKILLINDEVSRPEPETPIIDAGGCFVLSGGIDANIPFMPLLVSDDESIERFNKASILSGATTLLDALSSAEEMKGRECNDKGDSRNVPIQSDYGFHLLIGDGEGVELRNFEYGFSHEGITSVYLKWPITNKNNLDDLKGVLRYCYRHNMYVMVDLLSPDRMGSGYWDVEELESESVTKHLANLKSVLELAVEVRCKLFLLNISFKQELDIIQQFENECNVHVGLMLPYHVGSSEQLVLSDERSFLGFPLMNNLSLIPLNRIWQLLKSDNYSLSRPRLNLSGMNVFKNSQVDNRPDEFFLYKHYLSVLYSVGVHQGNINMSEFSELISTRLAKIMGLYPQKGAIKVGSDADIIIWNPDFQRNLYCYLPDEEPKGVKTFLLEGRVEFVFLKGHMVYNGESFNNNNVCGKYLYRSPFNK